MAGEAGDLTLPPLDEHEFTKRLPVWTALAQLFLDTEHAPAIRDGMARDIAASAYDIEAIDEILKSEVAPMFGGNLLSVAGAWELWGEDQIAAITRRELLESGGLSLTQRATGKLAMRMIRGDWKGLRQRVLAQRS
ncbi:DUF7079 family protein [Aurantiacibacter aquimixticola]|uniref:DUF7079 domain-containing protein n=1 Tax=Aurantiacibacter aquimixticola TaxID=1958945 RepID=A0A419RR87_9SPHN|nr:hypothetical protein [Aurantiacibacter aquimixticola]RJY08300.1 hypothetical protein D6201_02050 [Aurantiacibacter aquimixticola]